MRIIDVSNYKKCLSCDHCEDDDGGLYCTISHCNYKKIDYAKLMKDAKDVDLSKV